MNATTLLSISPMLPGSKMLNSNPPTNAPITPTRGGQWKDYEPQYCYSWERAQLAEYHGQPLNDVEPDLRREWEARNRDTPWDDAAPAVREVWKRGTKR